jgi:5-methylcytosine-specific restriction endonuclease McrA
MTKDVPEQVGHRHSACATVICQSREVFGPINAQLRHIAPVTLHRIQNRQEMTAWIGPSTQPIITGPSYVTQSHGN